MSLMYNNNNNVILIHLIEKVIANHQEILIVNQIFKINNILNNHLFKEKLIIFKIIKIRLLPRNKILIMVHNINILKINIT